MDGAIRDSHHVPAHHLKASDGAVDAVLAAAQSVDATTIVVHCKLSQIRGPACASRLASRLKEAGGDGPAPVDVAILSGGFNAWTAAFPEGDEWTQKGDEFEVN